MNEIIWHNRARKKILKIPEPYRSTIHEHIDQLAYFPACRQLDIKALRNLRYGYRLRVGRYRVMFDNDEAIRVILIQEVKKRDERTY